MRFIKGRNEVAIIGAGPAGISVAVQLSRYGVRYCLFERGEIGGLLRNAFFVENYPGFPDGIPGRRLTQVFSKSLSVAVKEGKGVILKEEVLRLDYRDGYFSIKTDKGLYRFKIVVCASGTKPKNFDAVPEKIRGRVLYEISPILKVKGKRIAIVGSGDCAFDYALNLGRHNQITILNRSSRIRCLPILWQRVDDSPRITYREKIEIEEIRPGLRGLELLCTAGDRGQNQRVSLFVHYLVGAIGREPNLDYITERLKAKRQSLEREGRLYLVGDVKNGFYRQAAIAVGDGIRTAMKIYNFIKQGQWK